MTMANADARELLQAYARGRDADAFAKLVQRYAGMVHGTGRPWRDGYELDIEWHDDAPTQGHSHFPGNPKPSPGFALIETGKWEAIGIAAIGPQVRVELHGVEVIRFEDDQFRRGQISIEGDSSGGVTYRNRRVTVP